MIKPIGQRAGGYRNAIQSDDPLVALLYLLGRDHISLGRLEGLVAAVEQQQPTRIFSNDFLAAYAIELAARLNGATPLEALVAARKLFRRPDR